MPPEPEAEDEPQILEGPDPRAWPGTDEVWGLVGDLRVIDQVNGLLRGDRHAMDGMSTAYDEALRLLTAFRADRCEQLALALLSIYGVTPRDDAGASPFSEAGKPRAFGADSPPAGNLPGRPPLRRPKPGAPCERGGDPRGAPGAWCLPGSA